MYFFRNNSEVESFDRYSNTGYKHLQGHNHDVGSRESDGFIANTFNTASSSQVGSLRYEGDFYASVFLLTAVFAVQR